METRIIYRNKMNFLGEQFSQRIERFIFDIPEGLNDVGEWFRNCEKEMGREMKDSVCEFGEIIGGKICWDFAVGDEILIDGKYTPAERTELFCKQFIG